MENEISLPFKVGELAEARSFQTGYRGAWFRCKIRGIKRRGHISHCLEYYDFPDEKLKWTKLYQKPLYYTGKSKEKHRELMLRPCYPHIYNENQMPDVISEVAVIVDNSWKVGNMVDWWTTDCYWSGRITQLWGEGKAQIELKRPPLGEGSHYEILLKDIRPSLDWSPEYGWTLPTQEGDTDRSCARLIKPGNQVIGRFVNGQETEVDQRLAGSSIRLPITYPVSSNCLAVSDEVKSMETMEIQKQSLGPKASKEVKDVQETGMSLGCGTKTKWADADSVQASTEPAAEGAEEDLNSSCPPKKHKVASGGVTLYSMQSNTLEAAILDLEEYINKVKWLKRVLKYGISSSDASCPQWEFVEPPAASEFLK